MYIYSLNNFSVVFVFFICFCISFYNIRIVKGLIQYKKTKICNINYEKGNLFSKNKNGGRRGKFNVERRLFFLNKKKIKKNKDNKKDNESEDNSFNDNENKKKNSWEKKIIDIIPINNEMFEYYNTKCKYKYNNNNNDIIERRSLINNLILPYREKENFINTFLIHMDKYFLLDTLMHMKNGIYDNVFYDYTQDAKKENKKNNMEKQITNNKNNNDNNDDNNNDNNNNNIQNEQRHKDTLNNNNAGNHKIHTLYDKIKNLKDDLKTNNQHMSDSLKVEKYINQQLIKLTQEIIKMREEKKNEEIKENSNIEWSFYLNEKKNPLNCFVYMDVPIGTVMLKPKKVEDKNLLISINALNHIKRNNQEILKNIYFKKFHITFDHIYQNCNLMTLIVNKLLDQEYIIKSCTMFSLLSISYFLKDTFYQSFLYLLSSKIIWNPLLYNIWCNIYHTTLPLKLFMVKQAFSYTNIVFNYIVQSIRNKLINLETFLLNYSLKSKIQLQQKKHNTYDNHNFKIATEEIYPDPNDQEEFQYI
ncbi:conserved Plasmodium protein, unknown function [Plasmodium sp. gorilla clade G2]|uniref:conserved Plasmodium protein, unknown function n=1 Tax=Plasmodium sp. gorilla clade G2 TaxID=880535 RepID=UPI000D20EB2D|nr:conserved Plasmodium protein, unknown function [Plasmodium sp. gorilla clade G2]SOV11779.1 conserved Plasmodium protein, unknown function [Plasmodium sp. gorilla clade G2]